jgi:hypothetical protein
MNVPAAALLVGLSLGLVGCGAGGPAQGQVKGKVTLGGQPVTGGSVSFNPIDNPEAKAAVGDVGADGAFQLSTNSANDGAAVGKHRVTYSAPLPGETADPSRPPPPSPYQGAVIEPAEVEVKSGPNEFQFQLKAAGS